MYAAAVFSEIESPSPTLSFKKTNRQIYRNEGEDVPARAITLPAVSGVRAV